MNKKGQASAELVILLPLFLMLAAGAMSFAYMCWQGIKVQQAANLAARMQGQERVSGSSSVDWIKQDNGVGMGFGDTAPEVDSAQKVVTSQGERSAPPATSVYGRFYREVQGMFTPGEQEKLFIPEPHAGLNSDAVNVVRLLQPPKNMGLKLPPIKLEATAYGGEDPHMYGLPRWGRPQGSSQQFYQGQITNPDGG
jgi:hypothetical protein